MSTTITNPVVTGNQSTFQYVRKIMFLGNNTFEAHAYKSTAGIKVGPTIVSGTSKRPVGKSSIERLPVIL